MPDPSGALEKVTFNRRFWGDYWLEALLYVVTLAVGWYVWLYVTAKTSQSPAKRLLKVYVIDRKNGRRVSRGRIWLGEVVVKQILFGIIFGSFTSGIVPLADGLCVFFDKNRQSLHERVGNTLVVYAPKGFPEDLNVGPHGAQAHSNRD